MMSRRYLSHVVHFLTVLLPIVCHYVSQNLLLRSSSLSQLTIISKLSPVPCSLYPPINGHCTNHRIADPQTKTQTYSTTKKKQKTNKQTNKQYTTNIIIIIIPLFYTSQSRHTNPYLYIMHIAKHTSLVYIQYISCTNIN